MYQPLLKNFSAVELIGQRLRHYFYETLFDERAFDIYIPPRSEMTPQNNAQGLVERLQTLIMGDEILSMLVIGDPGLGKTLLSYHLAHQYWQTFVNSPASEGTPCWLPVWLYLPSFSSEERAKNLLSTVLKQQGLLEQEIEMLQVACQRHEISLLIIIDGLDEIKISQENFYLSNGWFQAEWPHIKVVTFSRPEAFSTLEEPIDYQRLFYTRDPFSLSVSDTFKELYLQPFTEEDIDEYLKAFVIKKQSTIIIGEEEAEESFSANWEWTVYRDKLNQISPLSALAKNPFVLSILVQALPRIIQEAEKANGGYVYTRERVYHAFVQDWLERQARRIWRNEVQREMLLAAGLNNAGSKLKKPPSELTECLWTYSENLACFAWQEGKGKLDTQLSEAHTLRYELVHRPDKKAYFLEESLCEEVVEIIRSGCLLKCQGQVYRFLHKTIVEFFAAHALFEGAHIAADAYLRQLDNQSIQESFHLNDNSLQSEPQIIELLADL